MVHQSPAYQHPIPKYRQHASLFKKKKVLVFAILLIFFFTSQLSRAQDEQDENYGWNEGTSQVSVDLNSIIEINATHSYAVGSNGSIIKTVDGRNWTRNFQINDVNLKEIAFSGELIYTAGENGAVYKKNGSGPWINIAVPTSANLNSISVVNETVIFVAGTGGEIWKSFDSGSFWIQTTTTTIQEIFSLDMDSISTGLASGANGLLLGTTDGQIWEIRDVPNGVDGTIRSISYFSQARAFAVGDNGLLLKSSSEEGDAVGFVWDLIETNVTIQFNSIYVKSIFKFWIVGENGTVMLSRDGGSSFFDQSSIYSNTPTSFLDISVRDGQNGWITGQAGILLFTDQEGIADRDIPTVKDFSKYSVFFDFATPILNRGFEGMIKLVWICIVLSFIIGVFVALLKTAGNVAISIPYPIINRYDEEDPNWTRISFPRFHLPIGLILVFIGTLYTDFIRNTPLLVQLFIIHFGLPQLGIKIVFFGLQREFVSAIIGLSINSGAYQAEIIRSGIEAIPRGQMEAGRSLGMTYSQTMRHVILPQALRITIPPLGNENVNLTLNTSLAVTIGYFELLRASRLIIATTFLNFNTYMLVALYYFVITYALTNLLRYVENRTKIPGLGAE